MILRRRIIDLGENYTRWPKQSVSIFLSAELHLRFLPYVTIKYCSEKSHFSVGDLYQCKYKSVVNTHINFT